MGEGTCTVRERPGLADAAPRAWDKVLRREHVQAAEGRFSSGDHGESTLTWPVLLTAERIAAEPSTCYLRTSPADTDAAPLDVFVRYDEVLASAPDAALVGARDGAPRARDAAATAGGAAARVLPSHGRGPAATRDRPRGAPARALGGRLRWRFVERRCLPCLPAARGGASTAPVAAPACAATRRRPHASATSSVTTASGSASRSIRTSPSSPRTGTAATPATRARSTRRRASSCPRCAASGSSSRDAADALPRRRRARRAGHARVLRPDRPRARTSSTTSTSPTTSSSATGTRARDDPPRHAAQAHGPRPARHARRRRADGLRRAAAPLRALGLQRLLEPVLDAGLGARLPDAPTSRSRSATRATTCWRPRPDDDVRRDPRASSGSSRARRGALRADAPRVPSRLRADARPRRASPTRSGRTTSLLARAALLLRCRTRSCASCTAQGRIRDVAGAPLDRGAVPGGGRAASPTTPRSCSTTPCSTARSSSTPPTGRSTARCAAPTSTCWPSRRASVTRTEDELVEALPLAARLGRRRRRGARRVPRALLRARGRPRGRARRPPRLARRAGGPGARRRRRGAMSGRRATRLVLVVGVGPQRHEPARRDPRPARLPHPAARGPGRRHQPARLRRAALGRRLPHAAAAQRRGDRQRRAARRLGVDGARPRASRRPRRAARLARAGSSSQADAVVVKDPRTVWFLPLWMRCAARARRRDRRS